MLAQLATQFGHARGTHGALRDAIGKFEPESGKWVAHTPDPTELDRTTEVHARGAILVAAVFDAFLSIYRGRAVDLLRIASGGTGVLRQGELHPDLVARLADEAAKSAGHVLNICIRALDYCPPVDLTFGEYLRALITADMDLVPQDDRGYRVAFIEAFRRRGIYPRDVRTLSEDSLRWARPGEDPTLPPGVMERMLREFLASIDLRKHIDSLRYLSGRQSVWFKSRAICQEIHAQIRAAVIKAKVLQRLTGLALSDSEVPKSVRRSKKGGPVFTVRSVREARRQRADGRSLNQVFITILQKETVVVDGLEHVVRCGSTLVIDLDSQAISYVVRKGLRDEARLWRTIRFQTARAVSLGATYFAERNEPVAAMHQSGA